MSKEDIGRKVTAGGVIAISNWHVLSEEGEEEAEDDIASPATGQTPPPSRKACCR